MAVTSEIVAQGTLSDTVDTLRTGTGTEHHVFSFFNTHNATVIVSIYVNGDTHPVGSAELEADDGDGGGFATYECVLGSTDTLDAKADVDAVVEWTDEMDRLT